MAHLNTEKNRVLLIYPGRKPAMVPQMPTGVTVLASYLRKHGFRPAILDTRVENYSEYDFSQFDFIGISTMSGSQLSDAIGLAKVIKTQAPGVPLIWGGVHPTFYPEQTVESDLVDYVVRGEGEITLVDLLNSLSRNLPLDQVKGLTYMENGAAKENPDREFLNMEELDLPAYDLLKLERYSLEYEYLSYESSRGCPYACTFCYVNEFHNNTWRSKTAEKVLGDIEYIIKTFGAKNIRFVEDLWPVNKVRTMEILQGFLDRQFNIRWQGMHHARLLSRYEPEDFELINKSGCNYINIGGESGSDYLLKEMKKKTTADMLYDVAKKCLDKGIVPSMSFIIGSPGERPEDLNATLKLYTRLMGLSKRMEINAIFVYSPYPGAPLYDEAVKLGYEPKKRLEDWADWSYTNPNNTPWHTRSQKSVYQVIFTISRFFCLVRRMEEFSAGRRLRRLGLTPEEFSSGRWLLKAGSLANLVLYKVFVPIFSFSGKLRWKFKYFKNAFEWKLWLFVFERKYQMR